MVLMAPVTVGLLNIRLQYVIFEHIYLEHKTRLVFSVTKYKVLNFPKCYRIG